MVSRFRKEWKENGPMGNSVPPDTAIERLGTLKEKLKIRQRNMQIYQDGEVLFKLPRTEFPEVGSGAHMRTCAHRHREAEGRVDGLTDTHTRTPHTHPHPHPPPQPPAQIPVTEKEAAICDGVFGLFSEVRNAIDGWKELQWVGVLPILEDMITAMDGFAGKSKKIKKMAREWPAALQIKVMVDNFLVVLPMVQELSKESIRPRHWEKVLAIAKQPVPENIDEWLQTVTFKELIDMNLQKYEENIIEVTLCPTLTT